MALGFFRRHQKWVLLTMVLLMALWGVGSGIQGLFRRSHWKRTVGYAGTEKITLGMLQLAQDDIRILTENVRLGREGGRRRGEEAFRAFMALNEGRQPALAWALLLREAEQMGVTVLEREVDDFLAASGLEGERLQQEVNLLALRGHSGRDLRRAVAHHLMVAAAFEAGQITAMPSLVEIRNTYRDLRERIKLAMVTFRAEEFLAQTTTQPAESKIRQWFQEGRTRLRDHPDNRSPFGFGYRQPARVALRWLFVDRDRVARAARVPERMMRRYWRDHKGELTHKVRVPATATAPAGTQPATATAPAEPQYRNVPYDNYGQAKEHIREILTKQVAELNVMELLHRARELIRQNAASPDPYGRALAAMIHPASRLLARRVGRLPLTRASLRRLTDELERVTGVRVVFPYGQTGKLSLDPDVEVDLRNFRTDLTLGEFLEKVRVQLKLPRIKWVRCDRLEGAIFPAEPVNLVPISTGRTSLVTFEELASDELLGSARTARTGGSSLADVVATAEPFQSPEARHTPLIEVGEDLREALYVEGRRRGRLLVRLLEAVPEHDPPDLTPAIRRQVIEDIRLAEAFEKARKAAREMLQQVRAGKDLKKLAEGQNRPYAETGFFARKQIFYGRLMPSYVPGVGRNPAFLAKAFKLVPPDPDHWTDPGPAEVVALPRARKVLLIRRIGYDPPTEKEFRKMGLYLTAPMIAYQRQSRSMGAWFNLENIKERVNYQEATE